METCKGFFAGISSLSLLHLSSWVSLPCSLPVLLLLQMGYEGKRKIP